MERLNDPPRRLNCGCPGENPCEGRHGLQSCNNCEGCCECDGVALANLIDSARGETDLYSSWTDVVRFMWQVCDMSASDIEFMWRHKSLPGQVFFNHGNWNAACSTQCLNGAVLSGYVYAACVEDLPEDVRGWICTTCSDPLDPDHMPNEGECADCGDDPVWYPEPELGVCENCLNSRNEPECSCGDSHIIGDGTACATDEGQISPDWWSFVERVNTPIQLVIWTEGEILNREQLILI